MNGMWLLLFSAVYFAIAYIVYGRFIAKRFGVDDNRPCPSHTEEDGVDYVPTHPAVLFGHHFASIAGAGPIVGPVLAALFGWGPAVLWILLGCVFIGAMHDFSAMFLSVRHKGRSIAYAIEEQLGFWGRQIFLLFCLIALVLVVAVFTLQVADGFIANPSVATSSILFIILAPIFGELTKSKQLSLMEASFIFVPLLFVLVWFGTVIPFDLAAVVSGPETARSIWIMALLYYAMIASVIPVWLLLQPRDYLNSFLLYGMMIFGFAGVIWAKPAFALPALESNAKIIPSVMPLLFVTIACGACSGFHALVASGTSAKQLDRESHIKPVAYGSMLVEGILAILAVISIGYLDMDGVRALLTGPQKVTPAIAFAKGLAHFATSLGVKEEIGFNFISLAISAFMLTSLDTATRLARFVWQELMLPSEKSEDAAKPAAEAKTHAKWRQLFGNRWVATLIVVLLGGYLALSGEGMNIWPVFGASNQLLAALTLLTVTIWLARKKYPTLFAMLPMAFMMLISVWALIILIKQKWGNWVLVSVSFILLVLALALVALAFNALCRKRADASEKSN